MSGLLALLRWDLAMQYRYGFWAAALAVTATWVAVLRPLSSDLQAVWLPCLLYLDVGVIGLMFIAGLLFFERRQGVIDALVVTPMPTWAWLVSKLVALAALSTVVACALVLLTTGPQAHWGRLVPSFALVAVLFTLLGFLLATRFTSASSFFASVGLVGVPLGLPLLDYFEIFQHPGLWLNPGQPALALVRLAFRPGSGGETAAALLLTLFWVAIAFGWSLRVFHRRVSWRRGAA